MEEQAPIAAPAAVLAVLQGVVDELAPNPPAPNVPAPNASAADGQVPELGVPKSLIEKIMEMVKSKAAPFNKDQVFEQILNLKVVALETKHPKANFYSTVFQALREKMGGSDEQFKRYVLALLGDKDQEKVLGAMTKVDKALRVPSFLATPTFRGRERGRSLGGVQCLYFGEGEEVTFAEQGLVGDQLTIKRAVNTVRSMTNGYTLLERLEGFHFGIADWHTGVKFLGTIFKKLYSPKLGGDLCTLFSDRNLINRRNVRGEVKEAYTQCKEFFLLQFESRVVAAAFQVLGMSSLDDTLSIHPVPQSVQEDAQSILGKDTKVSKAILDTFVCADSKSAEIINSVLNEEEVAQEELLIQLWPKYQCLYQTSSKD
ncbi:hypothetical protein ACROYT_G014476 [Oculina patagonica]